MDLRNAKVLITGGSDGIGRGLAALFLEVGATVLITGRNPEKLQKTVAELPGLKTFVNDIGVPEERIKLAAYIEVNMPGHNIVINNAGIQRRVGLAAEHAPWSESQQEIDILLGGPIHLNRLLIPTLLANGGPSLIVNVTSGGAYIPQVFAPVYSACKAALHSYTITLRHALSATACRVVELIPPAVQTGLASPGAAAHGAPLADFCNTVFPQLLQDGITTVGYGPTVNLVPELSGKLVDEYFEASAARFPVDRSRLFSKKACMYFTDSAGY
jgi:uncharacterized oxidoreductase